MDAERRPVALKITAGHVHDGCSAAGMLSGLGAGQILLGDRAYDRDALCTRIAEHGAWANVKPMTNRRQLLAFSPLLYKYRNLVEVFFNKIKHFRAAATRYDKDPDNFLARVQARSPACLAASLMGSRPKLETSISLCYASSSMQAPHHRLRNMSRDNDTNTFDVLGVGFGPSNMALAIALEENCGKSDLDRRAIFLEKQHSFDWHRGMLLPNSNMQISFLKDLVSLRNPTSPYSFVNYLHREKRLERFLDCNSFYPTRLEFNNYLKWVSGHFENCCMYGETVIGVEPCYTADIVDAINVVSVDCHGEHHCRKTEVLVAAVGGTPNIPEIFKKCEQNPKLIHSSTYLQNIQNIATKESRRLRFCVIGSGQSAAEVVVDLLSRYPFASVELVFRSHALKPADTSPFVNAIFHPDYTDTLYRQSELERAVLIESFRGTNYSVVDRRLIDEIYKILYRQEIEGSTNLRLSPRTSVTDLKENVDGFELFAEDATIGSVHVIHCDFLILATGYTREAYPQCLANLEKFFEERVLGRDYRLSTIPEFKPKIYLQGYSESTHGLSDTLLSVAAIRAGEIAESILR